MKLTEIERLILSNQYKILKELYPDDREHYAETQKIVDNGFELFYSSLTDHLSTKPMSEECCREILDILSMFRSLTFNYRDLKSEEKNDIDPLSIKFDGFDGNNEIDHLSFARFIMIDQGKFQELVPKEEYNDLNSHSERIQLYKRMLDEWNKCKDKNKLNKEDILRVTGARYVNGY